jgi:hypothetical protein
MIDRKQNNKFRNFDLGSVQTSQFKEFNYENELTPIQARMYFLMANGSMPRSADESLYGWCGRIGLSNSTIFGIFKKNNKNMHLSVAQKISEATGANIEWVQKGIGEPFNETEDDVISPNHKSNEYNGNTLNYITGINAPNERKPYVPKSISKELLTQSIETAEQALEIANGTMTPEKKAEFISTLYFNQNICDNDEKLFKACVTLIEKALRETRRILSPEPKSELIIVIYNFYYDKKWTEEHLKSALDQLIRSVS